MSTVLITGGTGLIGTALTTALTEKGYKVIIATRRTSMENGEMSMVNSEKENKVVSVIAWDVEKQMINADAIKKADYIIHLAGAGVADKRWTIKRKKEIVESRTKSSALIVKSLKEIPNNVKAVLSASAIGWYGPDEFEGGSKQFSEDALPGNDFLGEACRLWEESIEPIVAMNIRLVKLRTGIVLSKKGGAFKEFLKPIRFGIAAILGSGKQMISWIHIDDLCRLYIDAIENENLNGVYNAVAPNPVNNKTLTLALARQVKEKYFIAAYVPAFILKLMLGEMSIEVLKSTNVNAKKIRDTGFQFLYPTIESALGDFFFRK
jgi:uncharacterized protein (TIGR01777 family)